MSLKDNAESFLEIHSFRVSRGTGFSVEIPKLKLGIHEWARIEAPSGFGKSTLVRGLSGISEPEEKVSGSFKILNEELLGLPPQKRNIGVVFQEQNLFSHLNAFENAAFGLKVRGKSHKECEALLKPWFERFGLIGKESQPITDLSGGERQRIAILRALIWKPQLLILDEPFQGLDFEMSTRVLGELKAWVSKEKVSVIWISHQLEEDTSFVRVTLRAGGTQHARVIE